MLLNDLKPDIFCNGIEVQNISTKKGPKVVFLEEDHVYLHEDDIIEGVSKELEDSKYMFRSPTGILKKFKEEFDSIPIAKKFVVKHKLDITFQELLDQWAKKADAASYDGTLLHGFAESIWNDWGMEAPELSKSAYVIDFIEKLKEDYTFVKTELLVFSLVLRLAGQVDLLLKDSSGYHIMDYKFIKAPLEKKSYYNFKIKKYKMMYGPFRFLYDTAFYHYSIQMELYRYLMGAAGKKVKSKTLIVVTPEKYEFVAGYPVKIWVNKEGVIQAKYKNPHTKKLYDSSKCRVYRNNEIKII